MSFKMNCVDRIASFLLNLLAIYYLNLIIKIELKLSKGQILIKITYGSGN